MDFCGFDCDSFSGSGAGEGFCVFTVASGLRGHVSSSARPGCDTKKVHPPRFLGFKGTLGCGFYLRSHKINVKRRGLAPAFCCFS